MWRLYTGFASLLPAASSAIPAAWAH